jgi:hypothetical protein
MWDPAAEARCREFELRQFRSWSERLDHPAPIVAGARHRAAGAGRPPRDTPHRCPRQSFARRRRSKPQMIVSVAGTPVISLCATLQPSSSTSRTQSRRPTCVAGVEFGTADQASPPRIVSAIGTGWELYSRNFIRSSPRYRPGVPDCAPSPSPHPSARTRDRSSHHQHFALWPEWPSPSVRS